MVNDEQNKSWGIKINTGDYPGRSDHPEWANPLQRRNWQERGFIIWDGETEQITKLWASQA